MIPSPLYQHSLGLEWQSPEKRSHLFSHPVRPEKSKETKGRWRVLPPPRVPRGKDKGKVGMVARSRPQAPHPTKFGHLVHQLLEALLLSLHLNEMLQLRVHWAQTRCGGRRRGIHPSRATGAEMNSVATHRPSRVSATEPEPEPCALGTAPPPPQRERIAPAGDFLWAPLATQRSSQQPYSEPPRPTFYP